MDSDKPKKDVPYLPRSWGSNREDSRTDDTVQTAVTEDSENRTDESDFVCHPAQDRAEDEEPEFQDTDQSDETGLTPASRLVAEPAVPDAEALHQTVSDSDSPSDEDASTDLKSDTPSGQQPGFHTQVPLLLPPPKEESAPQVQPTARDEGRAPRRIRTKIVGVRFGYACKIYRFDAGDLELACDDWVIVKTEKGLGLGRVAIRPTEHEIEAAQLEGLRKVIRKAGKMDFDQKARLAQKEREAHAYCLEKINALGLPMKLVGVECFFDGSKYVFYFTAEGRVDFRELVKQLVVRFPVRIEMRQIGVRHEAKMTGGIACCGQELCCARFLSDFKPVSVKMAKTQNLSLNPTKISGVCGRLMCCLAYEHETYEGFRKGLPKVGRIVTTNKGEGPVVKYNPLAETVSIRLDDETVMDVSREEIIEVAGPATRNNDECDEVDVNGLGDSDAEKDSLDLISEEV